jgi:hypothetical protein
MALNGKYLMFAMILFSIILVSSASPNFGVFKKNQVIEIRQVCFINGTLCDACNLTSISTNGTKLITNQEMTKREGDFNYTFYNTSMLGRHNVEGYCTFGDDVTKPFSFYFDITGTGSRFTTQSSIIYISALLIILFLFVINLMVIPRLPRNDATDEYGMIISINHLKYLRPVLYATAWLLVVAMLFISSNFAFAYMGTELLAKFLFKAYQILFWLSIPGMFIIFIYTLVKIFKDNEVKRLLERGIDVQGSI